MPDTLTWDRARTLAIKGFGGELPHPGTEDEIVAAFQADPVATLRARDEVIEQVASGKVRSGWAVWKARLTTLNSSRDVSVEIDGRPQKLASAERWIRNCGGHIDRESEFVDALFGPHGTLREWPELRERCVSVWEGQRPRFERSARESASYQAKLREDVSVTA